MARDRDARSRLDRLEQVLAQREPWFRDNTGNDAEASHARVARAFERLRELTVLMQEADADDPLERVTMRLMLEDYASIVSQLRASVRIADAQLASVAAVVSDGLRLARHARKRQA